MQIRKTRSETVGDLSEVTRLPRDQGGLRWQDCLLKPTLLTPSPHAIRFFPPTFASLSLLFLTKKGENGSQIAIKEEDGKSPLIRQVDGPPLVCITPVDTDPQMSDALFFVSLCFQICLSFPLCVQSAVKPTE